jgi:hypothetical protein
VEHRDLVARADIHRTPRHLQRPSGMLALVTGALSAAVAAAGHRRFVSNRSLSTRIRKRFPVSRSGLHKNHPPKIIVFCRGENKNGACAYKTIVLSSRPVGRRLSSLYRTGNLATEMAFLLETVGRTAGLC